MLSLLRKKDTTRLYTVITMILSILIVAFTTVHGQNLLSPLVFNANYYLGKYPDLRAAGFDAHAAGRHWQNYGIGEGRQASPNFHSVQYLHRYPDLQNAFGSSLRAAVTHYLNHGFREKRVGFVTVRGNTRDVTHAWVFNAEFYKNKYADLPAAGLVTPNALAQHWQDHGVDEGRQASPNFNSVQYLGRYPDLTAAFGSDKRAATIHYIDHGHGEKRVGFVRIHGNTRDVTHAWVFNAEFYKNKYADLPAAGLVTPNALAQHWQDHGVDEGRQASSQFHSVQYLAKYTDLRAAFGSDKKAATIHYIDHGHGEKRVGLL